jgi:hypothetical protein
MLRRGAIGIVDAPVASERLPSKKNGRSVLIASPESIERLRPIEGLNCYIMGPPSTSLDAGQTAASAASNKLTGP